MEDNLLIIISIVCAIIGFFGSFLPVLPGTILSWVGLLAFKFTDNATYGWPLLIIVGVLILAEQILNYYLPAYGSKKMGGSRYGMIGATVGMIVGVFFAPLGLVSIFIMPFIGAFAGEYFFQKNKEKDALRAALGTFIGFIISTGLSMMISLGILVYLLWQISKNTNVLGL